MTSREIRDTFLQFFKSKAHEIVPSAPVVIKNDPTLMFTNAGMNQFKALFLGEENAKFPRVADTQRCLRVSGKHNDLEEVGIDTYHHTLFEMLGNWSFGDYFKKEAIAWSWELLTQVYGLDPDRMYVTIFEGDASEGLAMDQEAYDFWKAIVPESRILKGNKKDNFWEMGETGPCGPCSEIHVDCRSEEERLAVDGATLVNADHPQVIEIWNLVFMQYNRQKDRSLQALPAQHVDTGMGFERLVRVIQGKQSNYDTDVFQPQIQYIASRSGIPYGQAESTDIAMRVMADHIRAICFAIADGQLPSNNKAGYVIRRILRRAVRYAYTFLGFKEPFLHELVPLLAEQFAGVFDELNAQVSFVQKVVLEEEAAFLRTLVSGVQRFENYTAQQSSISGEFAFELYDTYGFPIDLTELLAREKGLKVDMQGFQKALDIQKDRSRAATSIDTGDWVTLQEGESTEFVGYDHLSCTTTILQYRKIETKGKVQYQIVLQTTPFYPEGGGQVGDSGWLISEDGRERIPVIKTKKENALIIHFVDSLPSTMDQGWIAEVDASKRKDSERNHTATHLLHAALKQLVGSHVNQKGSLVSPDILRFDISHFSKLTDEEIKAIENLVNQKIRENIPLQEARNVPLQEALDAGITGLFGEKYGDYVRVITFDPHFSRELCGGTHVKATGEIGYFKIISESAVAAGVRRIEAITGARASEVIQEHFELVSHMGKLLNNPKDFVSALAKMVEDNQALRKEIEKQIQEKAVQMKAALLDQMEIYGDIHFLAAKVDLPNADAIKTLAYALKGAYDRLVVLLAADIDGKPSLTLVVSEALVEEKKWNASQLIREWAKPIQGGGGGQPFFATAGGKDASGIDQSLALAKTWINSSGG
jgi:alanyl-tRNA synthetase